MTAHTVTHHALTRRHARQPSRTRRILRNIAWGLAAFFLLMMAIGLANPQPSHSTPPAVGVVTPDDPPPVTTPGTAGVVTVANVVTPRYVPGMPVTVQAWVPTSTSGVPAHWRTFHLVPDYVAPAHTVKAHCTPTHYVPPKTNAYGGVTEGHTVTGFCTPAHTIPAHLVAAHYVS